MLSFSTVASKIRIAINTELDPYINVNLNNGPVLYSRNVEESYTYFDTTNKDFDEDQTTHYTFFNTI